jgi:hypothetical protein
MANCKRLIPALLGIFFFSNAAAAFAQRAQLPKGHVREYYIAAEPVEWDYAPSGLELMHGAELPYPWGLHRRWPKTRSLNGWEFLGQSFARKWATPWWRIFAT